MLEYRVTVEESIPDAVKAIFKALPEALSVSEVVFREIVSRAVLDAFGATGLNDLDDHEVAVGSAARWIRFGYYDTDLGYDTTEAFFEIADVSLSVVRKALEFNRKQGDSTMTDKPYIPTSIQLTGEALRYASDYRLVVEAFQEDIRALQEEANAKAQQMKASMDAASALAWQNISSEVGFEDPELAMTSGAWLIDSQYIEHGMVFLRRNADVAEVPAGAIPKDNRSIH